MDKNTIIGLLLIFGLFLGYSFYSSNKTREAREKQMKEAEAKAAKQAKEKANDTVQLADTLKDAAAVNANDTSVSPTQAKPVTPKNAFSYVGENSQGDYVVKTNKGEYHFSKMGGYVKMVKLRNVYQYTPKDQPKEELVLFNDNASTMSMELMSSDSSSTKVSSKNCYFAAQQDTLNITQGKGQLILRMHPYKKADSLTKANSVLDKSAYLEYVYTFDADDYQFGYTIHFVNMSKYLAHKSNNQYTLNWNAALNNVEKNYDYERDNTTLFYMDNLDEVENLDERASDKKDFSTELRWISFKQQFFTSTIISKDRAFRSGHLEVNVPTLNKKKGERPADPLMKKMKANLNFKLDNLDNGKFDMALYFGPNQYKILEPYDLGLEKQVPLGWGFFLLHWINRFVIIPIFNWLEAYGLSYGIIILILSFFIKIVIMPIAYKTYLSSAKMRVLKPQIQEINERYPKQEDAMKKQQATMTLYKKAGVSPAAGCIPMLIQMPILIAMFRFFPAAYELRQQPFLWAEDLSTYDSILDLSFNIPFYGDHVSLFTLLMTVATLVYTWLNNKLMSAGNDDQMKAMKIMMYLMPILFLGMFNSFSSALTYYYLLINLITFLQMWIFRMAIDEKKLKARIASNMDKPVKKTKWQMRMEEMMKQQQQLQKQQQQKGRR